MFDCVCLPSRHFGTFPLFGLSVSVHSERRTCFTICSTICLCISPVCFTICGLRRKLARGQGTSVEHEFCRYMRVLFNVGSRKSNPSNSSQLASLPSGRWEDPGSGRSLRALEAVPGACETSGQVMSCHACGSSGVTGHFPGNEIELASCRRVLWSRGRGRGWSATRMSSDGEGMPCAS